MPKKKYNPWNVGDLLVCKRDSWYFWRDATGFRAHQKDSDNHIIRKGTRVIFLGAKICPSSRICSREVVSKDHKTITYGKYKDITLKLMYNAQVVYISTGLNEIYQTFKLVQSIKEP